MKDLLPKQSTFLNTYGKLAKIVGYKITYRRKSDLTLMCLVDGAGVKNIPNHILVKRQYVIQHESGEFTHNEAQVHDCLRDGRYKQLQIPVDTSDPMYKWEFSHIHEVWGEKEPVYELY